MKNSEKRSSFDILSNIEEIEVFQICTWESHVNFRQSKMIH